MHLLLPPSVRPWLGPGCRWEEGAEAGESPRASIQAPVGPAEDPIPAPPPGRLQAARGALQRGRERGLGRDTVKAARTALQDLDRRLRGRCASETRIVRAPGPGRGPEAHLLSGEDGERWGRPAQRAGAGARGGERQERRRAVRRAASPGVSRWLR